MSQSQEYEAGGCAGDNNDDDNDDDNDDNADDDDDIDKNDDDYNDINNDDFFRPCCRTWTTWSRTSETRDEHKLK